MAITAGSRGIANIAAITRAIVEHLNGLGAKPFVVPAMGSHGGGTAEGQRQLIESYGITEQSVGCPIRSSMETVVVGQAEEGFPIHFDRLAFEADHVLVCNRVKPHTVFCRPDRERPDEDAADRAGQLRRGERSTTAPSATSPSTRSSAAWPARCSAAATSWPEWPSSRMPTTRRHGSRPCEPEQFEAREQELLVLAKRWLPRLPFPRVDVLLVDRIGKDISGTGLDSNVVGRKFNDHEALDDEWPEGAADRPARTQRSHARQRHRHGPGRVLPEQLLRRDRSGRHPAERSHVGPHFGRHGAVGLRVGPRDAGRRVGTIGLVEPADAKLLWIADTLHLGELECSAAYLAEARGREDLEILTAPRDLPFDAAGNLPEGVLFTS